MGWPRTTAGGCLVLPWRMTFKLRPSDLNTTMLCQLDSRP